MTFELVFKRVVFSGSKLERKNHLNQMSPSHTCDGHTGSAAAEQREDNFPCRQASINKEYRLCKALTGAYTGRKPPGGKMRNR